MLQPGPTSLWLHMLAGCCVQMTITKLCADPNTAVANCWFMMHKQVPVSGSSQCAFANELFTQCTLMWQQGKKYSLFFSFLVKETAHHQPTLLQKKTASLSEGTDPPQPISSYSIMEGSLVSRIWSVRIQGMDISMGNWMRRPMVSSRKNSRNQSWDRSQHCCSASETQRRSPQWEGTKVTL